MFDYMRVPNTCAWVLADRYCNAPVKYKMVLDDDDNRIRKYDNFCPEHKKKVYNH